MEQDKDRIELDHLDNVKGDSSIAEDVEPQLHWRTWAVVIACGILLFANNFGITATGFWLGAVIQGLGDPEIGICLTRKWLTVFFALVSTAGFFVAASVNDMHLGIFGTSWFGFSIIMYFTAFAIVSEVVPHRSRGLGQSVLYILTAAGGGFGCLLGGFIVNENVGGRGGWRWNIYISAILHVAGAVALILFYRPLPALVRDTRASYLKRLAKLDFVGAALFCCGWVPLLVILTAGGGQYTWNSTPAIVLLTVGIAFFLAFLAHQVFLKKDGILNHRLFRHRNFGLAMAGIFIEGWFLIPLNVFSGQVIGTLYESRPIHLGFHGAILWFVSIISSAVCGWYSKKYQRVKEPIIIGFMTVLGALIGFSRLTADPADDAKSYGFLALAGIGLGVLLTLLITVAQLAVPADLIGICSALFTGIRSCGAAMAVAICSAVFSAKLRINLPAEITKAGLSAGISMDTLPNVIAAIAAQNPDALATLGLSPAQLAAVQAGALEGYAKSYPYVFYVMLSGVACMIIAMFFLGDVTEMMSWKIDAPVEKEEDLGISARQDDKGDA